MIHTEKFPSVMVDIETLGTRADAVILSIAAIAFNIKTGERSNEVFYKVLDAECQLRSGRSLSMETLKWWLQQDAGVREEAMSGKEPLPLALGGLLKYILQNCDVDPEIWANSPAFDGTILRDAFIKEMGIYEPWNPKQERDVRTLIVYNPSIVSALKIVATHHPLQDAIGQVDKVCAVYTLAIQ